MNVNYNAKTGDHIEFNQDPATRGPRVSRIVVDTRPGSVTISPDGKHSPQSFTMSYEELIEREARFLEAH